ncbi:protein unc-13 homolog [Oryza brachyantha]|uniref:protein unc-13 homolog n=1 Tax=Oryza brachyantha TaxID=4533 RepID=UPI001AD965DE|nr:protein unc-13 homolog [Oryza brachyantha]
MARLFRDSSSSRSSGLAAGADNSTASSASAAPPLPSPLPDLGVALSASDLRATAYEILVAASRATGAKPLTYIPQSASASTSTSSLSSSIHHSLASSAAAASKVKKALGLRPSSASASSSKRRGRGRPATAADLVRVQLGVSEQADARIRRALLRIAAGQLGRHAESMVLPLEFLQRFKASDFPDPHEYEAWQLRYLKLLEAGLLFHPLVPLKKSDVSAQRLQQVIHGVYDTPTETEKNSKLMEGLYSAAKALAGRSLGQTLDECHWADGFPLNLHIYQTLVEACFDSEDGAVVDEIDEVVEMLTKTWVILGINQMFHNLCFAWALFNHFVMSGQVDIELLSGAENQLTEVVKDAKATKDPDYCDVLSSTINSIMGWTEKRLLAYHETFSASNIASMQGIVSIGVSTAKILAEDISHEYRRKKKQETDVVVHSRIETYIRSSLRTAFAQKMEEADSKRSSRNPMPVLSILAKAIGDLAKKERTVYSPILKKWHPLAISVAVATLHSCFGNEIKQFMAGLTELTPDTAQVLKAADKLEKDLVNIAVEDSADIDDGGKLFIREMEPYEAENVMENLVKAWVKERVDKLKEWIDRNLHQETWKPKSNGENFAPSSVKMMQIIEETFQAFFQLPITMHSTLHSDLTTGLDRNLLYYVSKSKTACGTQSTLIPQLPHLTRCDVGSKLFKKKEKPQVLMKRGSQVGSTTNGLSDIPELCVRINTLYYVQTELQSLEKKIKTYFQNIGSIDHKTYELNIPFKLSQAACQEGIRQLCETFAYKVIYNDLSHVLLDSLYAGDTASNRVEPLLRELDPILRMVSGIVHNGVRNRVITTLMKGSFDGFLLVLLAGGPTRAFTLQDSQMIEHDFRALRSLYVANGRGLPEELVDKASSEVKNILPLLRTDTGTLIDRFKRAISESCGSTTKSGFPMPPVPAQWSPSNPNTILRVLCYRNDEAATKFLKKAYNLPKKL